MASERVGAVTFLGKPLTVLGEPVKVGDKAPEFQVVDNDLNVKCLRDYAGKVKLIAAVPSLDTGVCDAETRRWNQIASDLSEDVVILTISADLPFAQKRWCGAAGVDRVITLSDHRDMSFALAYGTYVKELRLEQRSVFIVDKEDVIRYAEYVPEIAQHPDYDAALSVLREVLEG